MAICETCLHRVVCGKYKATGGVNKCEHYAEDVVRCKDCKHYMEYPVNNVDKRKCCYVHLLTPHFMLEDGFCSYGERRTDG